MAIKKSVLGTVGEKSIMPTQGAYWRMQASQFQKSWKQQWRCYCAFDIFPLGCGGLFGGRRMPCGTPGPLPVTVDRNHSLSLTCTAVRTSLWAKMVKCLPTMQETQVQSLGWEVPLEKEMATHSSILAWKIPWMEEPGRLQSMGSQRVRHDWETSLHQWCRNCLRLLLWMGNKFRVCIKT